MIGIKDYGMPRCCVNCQMCDAYEKGTCVITDTECEDMYSQRNGDCPLVEMSANNTSEQIIWERDTAIQQLKDLGYGLGEKPRKCDDCVSREAVIKLVKKGEYDITGKTDNEMFLEEVNKLPSVQPKRDKSQESED